MTISAIKVSSSLSRIRAVSRGGLLLFLWFYGAAVALYCGLRLTASDQFWWLAWLHNFAPYYFFPSVLALPLAWRLHAKRLSAILLGVFIIGFVWLLPRFSSVLFPVSDNLDIPNLTIVTFNVWGDNSQLDRVISWLSETNADVILLQEIPPAWAGIDIPQLANQYPYQVSQALEFRPWGDAILSRHPIVTHGRYPVEGDFAASELIEITWQGRTIAVYNAHLSIPQRVFPRFSLPVSPPFLNMFLRYDEQVSNSQVDRLLEIVSTENAPFVIGGDFNLSENAVKYRQLASHLNDSFREAGWGLGATWPNAHTAGLPSFIPLLLRIDYIWHSEHFRSLDSFVGPELGSDHFPLVSVLELQEND